MSYLLFQPLPDTSSSLLFDFSELSLNRKNDRYCFSDKMGEKGEHYKVGLDYDETLDYIGQFGSFQRRIFLWLSFVSAAAGLAVVVFAFTGKMIYREISFTILYVE